MSTFKEYFDLNASKQITESTEITKTASRLTGLVVNLTSELEEKLSKTNFDEVIKDSNFAIDSDDIEKLSKLLKKLKSLI